MAESRTPCAASDLLHMWLAKALAIRSTLPVVLRLEFSPQAIGRCSSDWNGTGSGSALVRSLTLPNLFHSARFSTKSSAATFSPSTSCSVRRRGEWCAGACQDSRLRYRQARYRECESDEVGGADGHAGLHVSRAVSKCAQCRRSQRRVCTWDYDV
jgi:hypothetical protein